MNTFDDRITPFIPGQPWAGTGQSSIDQQLDPNCTPGSVAKSLLNDIDPESILGSLQHKSSWPDTSTTNTNVMTTNNSNGNRQARGSWSSGNFNSPQPSQPSSIGEQLWGVRGLNGNGPINLNNSVTNANRMQYNSQFNNVQRNNVNMANNQQFLRSNSWNMTPPQQQQQQQQHNLDRSWNNNSSNGHYILLRNVPQQVA
jgi:hypothetical protein